MLRLSTLSRSTGSIQRRLLRPEGREMRRVIESNAIRCRHSNGKPPSSSGEQDLCNNDKQHKPHHSGVDGGIIYPSLDRQLLYEGGESENDATEDTSAVCTGCYLSPILSLSLSCMSTAPLLMLLIA